MDFLVPERREVGRYASAGVSGVGLIVALAILLMLGWKAPGYYGAHCATWASPRSAARAS